MSKPLTFTGKPPSLETAIEHFKTFPDYTFSGAQVAEILQTGITDGLAPRPPVYAQADAINRAAKALEKIAERLDSWDSDTGGTRLDIRGS